MTQRTVHVGIAVGAALVVLTLFFLVGDPLSIFIGPSEQSAPAPEQGQLVTPEGASDASADF